MRSLVASGAVMLGGTGLLVGAFFLNSLYVQHVLGWSALETGLAFLPFVLVIGVAAHAGPHLLAHAGARVVVVVGLVLVGAGYLLLSGVARATWPICCPATSRSGSASASCSSASR